MVGGFQDKLKGWIGKPVVVKLQDDEIEGKLVAYNPLHLNIILSNDKTEMLIRGSNIIFIRLLKKISVKEAVNKILKEGD